MGGYNSKSDTNKKVFHPPATYNNYIDKRSPGDNGDFSLTYIVENDEYFNLLSANDLIGRRCKSKDEYRAKYIDALLPLNQDEMYMLNLLADDADMLLKGYGAGIFNRVKWRFVKIRFDTTIEGGNPHTIGNVIVLPEEFFLMDKRDKLNILIHEKIHLWQRANRGTFDSFLFKQGYKKSNKVSNSRASNTDAMGIWEYNGVPQETMYASGEVSSRRFSYNGMRESHPYELFAYRVANAITDDLHLV